MKTLFLKEADCDNINGISFWDETTSPKIHQEFFMTLEQVAESLNVTQARVRQIEARALRKLQHPKRSGLLREFLF